MPLRIVHVVRAPVGGVFRHIADLAAAQTEAGHAVGLVSDSLSGGAFEADRIAALAPCLALGSVRLPMARQIALSDLAALTRVRAAVAAMAPDVVHAHGAKGGVFGRPVAAALRLSRAVVCVYAPHGGSLHYDPASLEGRVYFKVERALERLTDALIHVSAYEARAYVEKVGAPRCAAPVVRNGLTASEFEPVAPSLEAADFLYLGALRDLKGVDVFIDALSRLAVAGAAPTAAIVGDGPDEQRYRETVAARGLAVRFHPPMPARDAFALGRAIVVPSRAESMPYVVLEAIAAGLPIVATAVGGVPEIFGPYTPELAPPGDPAALADAMASVLADPARAARLALERRRHITKEFSLAAMAARVETVYRDAIERRFPLR